jgi:hypothetical protein
MNNNQIYYSELMPTRRQRRRPTQPSSRSSILQDGPSTGQPEVINWGGKNLVATIFLVNADDYNIS